MKKLPMLAAFLLPLAFVGPVLAQDAGPPKSPSAALLQQMAIVDQAARAKQSISPAVVPKKLVACSLCYTCGSYWPVFAGSFETTEARERTANCASGPVNLPDSRPYLCCRLMPSS